MFFFFVGYGLARVINESPFVREETRTRIAEIMQRVGYTPDPQARALAFRRSFLIGLIYDNPNAPYVINIQEGALGALRRMATNGLSCIRAIATANNFSPTFAASSAARSSMA